MEARYHGWSLFFGVCMGAVGAYILRITARRVPVDRLGVLLGALLLLVAGRFVFGALTGRIPAWMVTFIDADK